MLIMGSTEVAHWGQCFEEFYGQSYCKYLRKDLEKLKDEFYDGNSHRFQSEWVIPTANLLRRLRHMGFPIRTQDHIIIHLYNPVDSMAVGEGHFQVGRKAPGTLTLKFTKQNNEGVFVIQPKTLSNKDEIQLNKNPIDFLNKVRLEMKDSCLNTMTLLQTLVLMTDNCKLERRSIKVMFFGWEKVKNFEVEESALSSIVEDCPPLYPPCSGAVSFNINRIDGSPNEAFGPPAAGIGRRFSETNYPVPWSFCVKNYVSYNDQNKASIAVSLPGPSTSAACFQQNHESNLMPGNLGLLYRQSRSTTWHSEPEENDETMDLHSMNEINIDGFEDIRSIGETKLCNQPAKPILNRVVQRTMSPHDGAWMSNERRNSRPSSMANSIPDYNMEAKCDSPAFPNNHAFEKYNDLSLYQPLGKGLGGQRFLAPTEIPRRYSESHNVGIGDNQSMMSGVWDGLPSIATRIVTSFEDDRRPQERTTLTEEYAGDNVNFSSAFSGKKNEKPCLKGTFTNAISAIHGNSVSMVSNASATSPRTATVDDYTGCEQYVNQNLRPGVHFMNFSDAHGNTNDIVCNELDARRTSSLDAYIGNDNTSNRTLQECIKAKSDCSLHTVQKTNILTDYFQENRCANEKESLRAKMWQGDTNDNTRDLNQTSESSLVSSLNIPNISLLYKDVNYGMKSSSDDRHSESPVSWMSHAPISMALSRGQTDSLNQHCEPVLSHDSFPSWGSHHCEDATSSRLLPITIEEINNDVQFYPQKSSPRNS